MTHKKENIKNLSLQELEAVLKKLKQPVYHSKQIFSWIYKKGADDFQKMTDLSSGLREKLDRDFYIAKSELIKKQVSSDGTAKFLFRLEDGNLVESVFIPTADRNTICVSTQVGCKFACRFCASAIKGFVRNLEPAEIINQIIFIKDSIFNKRINNVVFMGMGEPLDNYDNVLKAIRILNSPFALNIGARKITISTCGIIRGIEKLAQEGLQIELSISLHAADDKTRSKIMPVNKKYPLKDLIKAVKDYIKETNRQITFEYVLIKGINSDLQNAQNLSKLMRGLNCKVNLIPANFIKECNIEPPNKLEILLFRDYLIKQGINVTLRKPRGEDIEAACGQLRLKIQK